VFFCDSGSVAVEVAIKMALQYWQARGSRAQDAPADGARAATTATPSVRCPSAIRSTACTSLFRGVLPNGTCSRRVPAARFRPPLEPGDIAGFEALLALHRDELAAVILEPIVQGAGGMWFYSADYLRRRA
jgi:adenosylmethionine-8-amino-7-oxononanoate aminotransferase